MSNLQDLFSKQLKIINIGASNFKEDFILQGADVIQLDWQPPAGGKKELIKALDKLSTIPEIEDANKEAIKRIKSSHPVLVDISKAVDVIPQMKKNMILHAGPPITWEKMCGPMQGAVIGALLFEGMAQNVEEARKIAASGQIEFSPCHEHNAVGPMAGIISPSMPVHVVLNKTYGNYAYCTVNEGLGKVLRYGAYNEEVLNRLKWIKEEFAPVLKRALELSGGIDLKAIISQALHMGDECHNRNKAATSLFFREIALFIVEAGFDKEHTESVLRFIRENEHYFLNLSMPACKSSLDAGHGIKNSTTVVTMARNGVEFGIRVSGLGKDQWFTGPANFVKGLMFPGFTEEDASPDIGDSAITETMGIGGFAMAGAPAIVQFVGGVVEDAVNYTREMYEITNDENSSYSIPNLDFRGTPIGIDIMKVIQTGVLPIINTGMAHKQAGVGQVGAGLVKPPKECFEKAVLEFANRIGKEA